MADFGIGEAMMAVSALTTAASVAAEQSQAKAQAAVIQQQSQLRANQTAAVAGQQENQAAMKARAQEAYSVAAASSMGVSTGSNSFLASIQTTNMNQANEDGLITENEQNQQQANIAQTQSDLNSKASAPSLFGGLLSTALAGTSGYMKGGGTFGSGTPSTFSGNAVTGTSMGKTSLLDSTLNETF